MHPVAKRRPWMLSAAVAAQLAACTTIAPYNEKAYENATAAKAEALAVLARANEDFQAHATDVKTLELDMSKAAEFAKGLPKNELTTRMYVLLMDDANAGSLYGVLGLWERQHKLDPAYVAEIRPKIGEEFDQLIALEQGKIKQ